MIQYPTSYNHAKTLIFSVDVFQANSLTASLSIIRLTINLLFHTSQIVSSLHQLAHASNMIKPALHLERTPTASQVLPITHLAMALTTVVFQFRWLAEVLKLLRTSIVESNLRRRQRSKVVGPAAYGCGPIDPLAQKKAHDSTNAQLALAQ